MPLGLLERMWIALRSLERRLLPPRLALMELATGIWPAMAIRAAIESGIIEELARESAPAARVAASRGLESSCTLRLLRLLAGYGVVRERADEFFELTRIGRCAVAGIQGSVAPFVRYVGEEWELRPWQRLSDTLKTGTPAFELIYGMPFFEYAHAKPEVAQLFTAAMESVAALHADAVAGAYDFTKFTKVVDVGGGNGTLLALLLRNNPRLHGVLFDLPHVAERARDALAPFGERAQIEAGDFFLALPADADLYLLSHVLHDWDDAGALQILRSVRKAMLPHGRALVVECVLSGARNRWDQGLLTDVQMMAVLRGRERTLSEFAALFAKAQLRIVRVVNTSAAEKIIEIAAPLTQPPD